MSKNIRILMAVLILFTPAVTGWSQTPARPTAPQLLPEWTVAMVRVRDSKEFRDKLARTGLANMLRDEQFKPLAEHLHGSATELAQQLEERLGMTIEQLLEIPQGEVTIAMCAPPALPPVAAVIMDTGEKKKDADALLEEGAKVLVAKGFSRETVNHEGFELDVFSRSDGDVKNVVRFERDNTIVITTDLRVAERIADAWRGADVKTLSENSSYATIFTRCQSGATDATQLNWFADPIGVARAVTRGNAGAATALAILPALGLDGLKGIGGTTVMPESEFEGVTHMHLHLENPRDGVLEMITLKQGDSQPEPWVPSDVMSYTTSHIDIQASYSLLKDLFDSFRGETAFAKLVKSRVSEPMGIDFEQDLIAQLEGRVSLFQWYERPARIGSQANLLAFKLRDAGRFAATFEKVMEKFSENLEETNIGGQKVFRIAQQNESDAETDNENTNDGGEGGRRRRVRTRVQAPQPSFAVMDGYLILSDRPAGIERMQEAKSDREKSLSDAKDFQSIMEKLRSQPNSESSSLVSFSRPVESIRMLYELLQSERTREFISERREDNPVLKAVDDALTKNPLPPFSALESYLTPQGAILTNEESGIHSITLTLRNEDQDGE